MAVVRCAVAGLIAVTCTPGMTAPVESVTMPEIVACGDCASKRPGVAIVKRKAVSRVQRTFRVMTCFLRKCGTRWHLVLRIFLANVGQDAILSHEFSSFALASVFAFR